MGIWGQNILIDGTGEVAGLVDFDRVLWGGIELSGPL
jgi:hypothetical protein